MMTKNASAQKNTDADLESLAKLIRERSEILKSTIERKVAPDPKLIQQRKEKEKSIADMIPRKVNVVGVGHIAEYIASSIFHIGQWERATKPGGKGFFMSGSRKGKSVIVKMYGVEGSDKKGIDIRRDNVPDYYLVFKCSGTGTNKKFEKHWLIKEAFLFEAKPLIGGLKKIADNGLTTIKPEEKWNKARIYPILPDYSPPYRITDVQQQALRIFEPK